MQELPEPVVWDSPEGEEFLRRMRKDVAGLVAREVYGRRLHRDGYDFDDLVQEAMIYLLEAARDYKPELGSWPMFWRTVVKRRFIQLVIAGQRDSRRIRPGSLFAEDASGRPLIERIALVDPEADVEAHVEARDEARRIIQGAHLSNLEARTVFHHTVTELAGKGTMVTRLPADYRPKAWDNAWGRARTKLREAAVRLGFAS